MEITVNVEPIDLNTVIGETVVTETDYDGDTSGSRTPRTLGDEVVDRLVDVLASKLYRESAQYVKVHELVAARIAALIDAQVGAIITGLLETGFVQLTNQYGRPQGEPTTLKELIINAGQAWATGTPKNGTRGDTNLGELVRREVEQVMRTELSKTIAASKAAVQAKVATSAAAVLSEAVKDALR